MPDYRNNRPHSDFVSNIDRSLSEIKTVLSEIFGANQKDDVVLEEEKNLLSELLQKRSASLLINLEKSAQCL